jgi:hypothetical protein
VELRVEVAHSVNGVPIRLTDERWAHIVSNKPYMSSHHGTVLDAIEDPTWVLRGYGGALVAVLSLGPQTYLHVVYREVSPDDGFVVTAFLSRTVNRRLTLWPERS